MRSHIKAVPGRKTDIKDAEWIADLLQHGLLRASFVPPAPQRHLRELTRYRSTLLAERARLVNRLHKVLEDTNLKLTAVVTNIMGLSARCRESTCAHLARDANVAWPCSEHHSCLWSWS